MPGLSDVLAVAQRVSPQTGWPVSVHVAQLANESAWFTSNLSVRHNNRSGIKFVNQAGATKTPDGFAHFESTDAWERDYVRVCSLKLYDAVRVAARQQYPDARTKALACAAALGATPYDAGHYAGASGQPGKVLFPIIEQYQLWQYDGPAPAGSVALWSDGGRSIAQEGDALVIRGLQMGAKAWPLALAGLVVAILAAMVSE